MFLYHLATNESAQESLAQEAKTLLPTLQSSLTSESLNQARYVKAALKESLRLNPISVGVGRILSRDTVLSGCKIPKGVSNKSLFFSFKIQDFLIISSTF